MCPPVTRRVEEMGDNLHAQLKEKAKDFVFFSLAMDKSNDVQDTAQLLIFIWGVSSNFEVYKVLQSLTDIMTGKDIFGKVCQTMEELDLAGQHHNQRCYEYDRCIEGASWAR